MAQVPIDPDVAENYRGIADDPNDPRGWPEIADMADEQGSPTLAAFARAQAASGGKDLTPRHAVSSYRNTRSKGLGKDPDGINEPPESFDKTTPGTRFPTLQVGDVVPTSIDPTGQVDERAKDVSQNPSTAAKHVQADPTAPVAVHPAAKTQTVAAPSTVQQAQQAYNPQVEQPEPPPGR